MMIVVSIPFQTHHCNPGPKPVPPSVTATLARLKHCPPLEVIMC